MEGVAVGAVVIWRRGDGWTDRGTQMKREKAMEAKRKHIIYKEEFRRQAVEMVIHSGKTQAQVARELGCSEYSLNLWKKAYLRQQAPTEIDGEQRSPEQMLAEIRPLPQQNQNPQRQ